MTYKAKLITICVLALLLFGGGYLYKKSNDDRGVMCTLEAMQCLDGSYVGRSGPKCEFTPCPQLPVYDGWKSNSTNGVSFQYPESFGTKYISTVDWPPQANLIAEPYSCLNAGTETERAGRTESRVINGNSYCITTLQEGAAGSIYKQHAYSKSFADKTLIFTFSTKEVQCGNFPYQQMSECESERSKFSIDKLLDIVINTAQVE